MLKGIFSRHYVSPEEEAYKRLAEKGYRPGAIIDVGAYEGNWTRLARSIFPDAPILMCEAQPAKRAILDAVVRELDAVSLAPALLSREAGKDVSFFAMETGSSMKPENSNVEREELVLTTTTLDEVAKDLAGPIFLKIDVQGAELDVLAGGEQTLAKADLVQLEIAVLEYNKGAPSFVEVVNYMDERGFAPYDLAGWSRPHDVDLVQVDWLFTRKDSPLRTKFFEF